MDSAVILSGIVIILALGMFLAAGYPHLFWCPARRHAPPNGSITIAALGEIEVACCTRCNSARVRSHHAYLRENDLLVLDKAKKGSVEFLDYEPTWDCDSEFGPRRM